MAISVENQKSSQALRGEDVVVTFSDIAQSTLSTIPVGTEAYIDGTSIYGVVARVDVFGTSLEVSPLQPDLDFASPSHPGYLYGGETVVFNI
jgi:hypothetical protein